MPSCRFNLSVEIAEHILFKYSSNVLQVREVHSGTTYKIHLVNQKDVLKTFVEFDT